MPRAIEDENPPTNIALPHEGLAYRFPFDTEKKTYPYFDPIAQKAYDANYEGEEDVNGLSVYKFTQNVGFDADGKLVEPIKFSSLYDKDEDGSVTARAELWGVPSAEPTDPIMPEDSALLEGTSIPGGPDTPPDAPCTSIVCPPRRPDLVNSIR